MSANPYLITGPAVISFSGGRTSAYMLRQILDAHGGTLPDDVQVAFANTGKERPETLRFVYDVQTQWGVPVNWIEWRAKPKQAEKRASLAAWLAENDPEGRFVHSDGFERVGFNSAARNGEPFAALIAMKQRLPNWTERWCTEFLKVLPLFALAESFGWAAGTYQEVIGLRADEPMRVLRSYESAKFKWDRKTKQQVPRVPPRLVRFPLSLAKVEKADVMAFWRAQPFDLQLQPHEGNCDLCFMKGKVLRKRLIRDVPGIADWWNKQEIDRNKFFDRRDRVRSLIEEVRVSPEFFGETDDEEADAECGASCGGHLMAAE